MYEKGSGYRMGLYINSGQHPTVYKNNGQLKEPNQAYLRIDYFSEMLKEQQRVNQTLMNSFHHLQMQYEQQKNWELKQWKDVGASLDELKESNQQYEKFTKHATDWLNQLEQNYQKLQTMLESESSLNKEIVDQIQLLSETQHEIIEQLNQYKNSNQEFHSQMDQIMDYQKQLLEKAASHEEKQQDVIKKLDNQEAIMEKTNRQVTDLRSILYERASYLSEKIEEGYQLISSFFYNLLTGKDSSFSLLMIKPKKEESKEN
jgi:methyl-accepting chemotaxis protein